MERFIPYLLSILILSSCSQPDFGLDDIKQYKPDDKYFKASLRTLHFVIETSAAPRIDSLFQTLQSVYELPTDATGCPDGSFVGESPPDAYDYRHVIEIEIKNEKIVSVDYDEILKNNHGKESDSLYCAEMSVMGTTPAIAYPKMEKQLLENQDILDVDAVSGASFSLYRFRYAATIALIRARLARD